MTRRPGWRCTSCLLAALLLADSGATAHPLAPALLEIEEQSGRAIAIRFKAPARQAAGVRLRPALPAACSSLGPARMQRVGTALVESGVVDCGPGGLEGLRFGVDGLQRSGTDALLRVALADGRRVQAVLRPDRAGFVVPARPAPLAVARDYLRLGAEHIATGFDHLLFVFGLLLLVGRRWGSLVRTVTAFTVGHSVTLSLAALGFVYFPTRPIELAIAASVLLLAVELARPADGPAGPIRGAPWRMAGAFGLLHGLGFAGALAEVGLPDSEIPLALLAFNLGIELGQLAFVAAILALGRVLAALALHPPARARSLAVQGLGTLAAYWCFERGAGLFG